MTNRDGGVLAGLYNAAWAEVFDHGNGNPHLDPARIGLAALGEVGDDPCERKALPVLSHLQAALDVAKQGPLSALAEQLEHALPELVWSQNEGYVKQGINRQFLDGYAYACISAPQGPIVRDVPLAGFILLAPDLYYPPHHHAPREVYLPLTPASWQLDKGKWFDVSPGQIVVHDTWQIHATRTGIEPFLAFVAWIDEAERNSIKWA